MLNNLLPAPFNLRVRPDWTLGVGPGDWIDCDLTGTDGDTLCLYVNGGGPAAVPTATFPRTALPYLFNGPQWGQDGSPFGNGNLYTVTLKDAGCGCESVPSACAQAFGGRAPGNPLSWVAHTPPTVPTNLIATAEWNGDVNGGTGYSRILLTWDVVRGAAQVGDMYNVYKNGKLLFAGLFVFRAFDPAGTSADTYTVTSVNAYSPGLLESAPSSPASCTVLTGPPAQVTGWGGIVKWSGSDDSGWATLAEPLPVGGADVAVYKGTNTLSLKAAGTTSMGDHAFSTQRHPLAIDVKGLNKAAPETITAVLLDKLLPYVPDTGRMLPGQMGMVDNLPRTWTNGQGDPSNVPNVLAVSIPYQTALTPAVPLPGGYLKTDADYTLGAPLPMPVVTPGLPSGIPPHYGNPNDYRRQEGADVIFEQFGTDTDQTELFGMAGHGMVRVADGGRVGTGEPTHNNNAAACVRLKDKVTGVPFAATLDNENALSFTFLSDAHNDGRGRMRLLLFPAGDTLINPGKFSIGESGNNYATLSGTCLVITVSTQTDIEYFEGGNRHDLYQAAPDTVPNSFGDLMSMVRQHDWCPQPEMSGSCQEIDKAHLFEFVFSANRYRYSETTHDGMTLSREREIVGLTLPQGGWQCALAYEPYHTSLERTEMILWRPYERHGINNTPYSRVWHFDNLQFGARTLAAVGFPGAIAPPVIVPPVVVDPPIVVPPPIIASPPPPVAPPVVTQAEAQAAMESIRKDKADIPVQEAIIEAFVAGK